MSKSRLELKVGFFVSIGLILVAFLLLQFSKGMSLFQGTYEIRLKADDAGGLKVRAAVLMSGVQVGTVSHVHLASDGKSVVIFLKIYNRYQNAIYKDALFAIQSSGFLGDQFVSIKPTKNAADVLKDGDEVTCETPLNIEEVARSAAGFIKRVDDSARMLNSTIVEIRRLLLNEDNLTNLSVMVHTMRAASESALATLDQLHVLIETNGAAITGSASNLVQFSAGLDHFSDSLNLVLATNSDNISVAVKNIEESTVLLKGVMQDVDSGKGLAGTLLHNEQVAANVTDIVYNLSITTSNMNRLGLWRGVLFPKKPSTPPPPPGTAVKSPREQSH